jgi:hypothetical protein
MLRVASCTLAIFAIAILLPGTGNAQGNQAPKFVSTVVPSALPDASESLPPLKDPATIEQIREYLRLSGDLDAYKARWIAAVDKNRSIGAPYWPESFWTSLKEEMQKTDLMPMYVVLYRHSIKRGLMQEVLDAYQRLGAERFRGSPECSTLSIMEVLYGLHPVEEALKAGGGASTTCWWPASATMPGWSAWWPSAARPASAFARSPRAVDAAGPDPAHQGVVALVHPQEFLSIEDLFAPTQPSAKARPACCWLWMASKTRRIWALCCAWPTAPAWTAWC